MTSKIKALGLGLVATLAFAVVSAAPAHASQLDIGASLGVLLGHSESGQQHVLSIPDPPDAPFNAVCDTSSFEGGTVGQFTSEVTVTPTYGPGCRLAGTNATVQMNGCRYTATGGGQPSNTGVIDIVGCTTGKQIQIKSAICSVDIPAQNNLSHVVGSNLESNQVTVNSTVTGITAVQTGAVCPQGNNAHTTGASFSGNTIVKAFVDIKQGIQLGIEKHGHEYFAQVPGSQVSLVST